MNQSIVAEDAIIDLEALKTRCLGNLALVERVLNTFAQQLDADLTVLKQAIETEDLTTAAFVAHRIKGMSASAEARRLCEHASQAEEQARNSNPIELRTQFYILNTDRAALVETLQTTRRGSHSTP